MSEKKAIGLIIDRFVCITSIMLIKFIYRITELYQITPARKPEKTLEIVDKATLRGRFSPSFYLKTPFHITRLHPL